MRICDLTNLYIDGGEGGVNTYLKEKTAYFGNHAGDVEHSVIVPTARSEVTQMGAATLYGIASPRYFRNPQHRILFNRRAITEILRRVQPDVVEVDCASFLADITARALRGRVPATVLVGFYHVHLPTFFARDSARRFGTWAASLAEGLSWRFVKRCLRPLDRVVVSSQDIFDRLVQGGISADRLQLIPLGVNEELFRPGANGATPRGAENGGAFRNGSFEDASSAEATSAKGVTRLLYVGRLSKEKALPVLFSAFDRLAKRGDYRLRFVGDGPLESSVKEFARQRPNVECVGLCPYGETLARYYRDADVVTIPSPSETFGLAMLEALASGVPVVAIRRGGPSKILSAEHGALAEPGDAADFAAKIERVAATPRNPDHHRRFVVERYTWRRTFESLGKLYRELTANGSHATLPSPMETPSVN